MKGKMSETVNARVESVTRKSPRVSHVVLRVPPAYHWRAGQHLAVLGENKLAYYSIASADGGDGALELVVADSPDVSFVAGAELFLSAPEGPPVFPSAEGVEHCCFVAMGTGVAPLRAAIQESLAERAERGLTLLHGARTEEERLFSEEFEALARAGELDYRPVLSQPTAAWPGRTGRVQRYLEELPGQVDHFGICGSLDMVEVVRRVLLARGAKSIFAQGY